MGHSKGYYGIKRVVNYIFNTFRTTKFKLSHQKIEDMEKLISPNDIIGSGLCIGCGSCVIQHDGKSAKMGFDKYGEIKPQGNSEWLNEPSKKIAVTCPFSPFAIDEDEIALRNFPHAAVTSPTIGRYEQLYVGYSNKSPFRENGSSGGMVSWIASALLDRGLIDGLVHVVAVEGTTDQSQLFAYQISKDLIEISKGAKSRYYPTEMSKVLKLISENPGRYAVVGVPCFIKAVQLLRDTDPVFKERIPYTLGLFCGHMKSSKMVESFAIQSKIDFRSVSSIDFRSKKVGRPANLYFAKFSLASGRYMEKNWDVMADGDWGAGFFMNHACNFCDDVVSETADISFGDAWIEPYSSDYKGTNVIIVRSKDLQHLVDEGITSAELNLEIVDSKFIEETQAAGIRQRREGLSFRLAKMPPKIVLKKRVAPRVKDIPLSRRISYRLRYSISFWSHEIFFIADKIKLSFLYVIWAKITGAIYQKIIYHRVMVASVLMGISGALLSICVNLVISFLFAFQILLKWEYSKDIWYFAVCYPMLIMLILVPSFVLMEKKRLNRGYFDLTGILLACIMILFPIIKSTLWQYILPYSTFVITDVLIIRRFLKKPVS